MPNLKNIFDDIPADLSAELVQILAEHSGATGSIRIERIISPRNHASPPGSYYDQSQTEFVLLLQGEATLDFPDETPPFIQLKPGDHLTINPHQKHRIASTSSTTQTIWLTVFF